MSTNEQPSKLGCARALNIREVSAVVGLSKGTIYGLLRAKRFPPPVRPVPGAVRWISHDVSDWLEKQRDGSSEEK